MGATPISSTIYGAKLGFDFRRERKTQHGKIRPPICSKTINANDNVKRDFALAA